MIVREEIQRHKCVGDDGTPLLAIEFRLVETIGHGSKIRRRLGATRAELRTGETLRIIDAKTFEVTETGELIRRTG